MVYRNMNRKEVDNQEGRMWKSVKSVKVWDGDKVGDGKQQCCRKKT